jgi:hypothetical protein
VGEMEIASNGHYAFLYAQNIIKGKWPEGEKAIMSDPELAHSYTQFLLYDKHFLMGEKP